VRKYETAKLIRSATISATLLAVGAGIAALGFPDPRKEVPGAERNHPLLVSFLKALADEDDPSHSTPPHRFCSLSPLPHCHLTHRQPVHRRPRCKVTLLVEASAWKYILVLWCLLGGRSPSSPR
jgi:hypothetical protein